MFKSVSGECVTWHVTCVTNINAHYLSCSFDRCHITVSINSLLLIFTSQQHMIFDFNIIFQHWRFCHCYTTKKRSIGLFSWHLSFTFSNSPLKTMGYFTTTVCLCPGGSLQVRFGKLWSSIKSLKKKIISDAVQVSWSSSYTCNKCLWVQLQGAR